MAVTVTAQWKANVYNFDYTGRQQTFTVPATGYYKLETWGAQGGYSYRENTNRYRGGYGAYAVGIINRSKNNVLYVNVGGKGTRCAKWAAQQQSAGNWPQACGNDGGYNGGGYTRQYYDTKTFFGSGGGATSIALVSGVLQNLSSQKSNILIIAAGGGGASFWGSQCENTVANPTQAQCSGYDSIGGNGGGIKGSASVVAYSDRADRQELTCPTQTSAGTGTQNGYSSFGLGGNVREYIGPGGGGGLYGGSVAETMSCGGSSYIGNSLLISNSGITKHMTCYSCTTSTAAATRTNSNTNAATSTATADRAKLGNGYARITYLGTSI